MKGRTFDVSMFVIAHHDSEESYFPKTTSLQI
jgi:hypothetical protein